MSNAPTPRTTAVTLEDIREHFPALNRRHGGNPVAYFDGPGGTQVPRAVVEAMSDYLYHHNANTHWGYPTSAETDRTIEEARKALADFLNASPAEVAFGANMTTLTFHLARALGRGLGQGDEILLTELDHHANVAPWRALERERGLTVKVARMIPETGQIDWKDFERQLTRHCKVVALGAASNALGTVNDVRKAAELARSVGALLFVDAVHYAPHVLVDVQKIECDFLACSAYKFYGPHAGVLFGKKDRMEAAEFPKLAPAPETSPERAETGTQNHEGMAGAAAAVDFLASFGHGQTRRARLQSAFDSFHANGQALIERLWEGLSGIQGVRVYGPPPSSSRTPTISFTVEGVASSDVTRKLADRGVFVSHGNFYAATVVERLGLGEEGLVRVGCACYTTPDEVERLIEGVRQISR
ncbi:MAG TPA: cysteine desulfurase-like protein [Terriglobia bacterium]|nr:cysteine desulfurase-like protein [Terriglobia bacterium]